MLSKTLHYKKTTRETRDFIRYGYQKSMLIIQKVAKDTKEKTHKICYKAT